MITLRLVVAALLCVSAAAAQDTPASPASSNPQNQPAATPTIKQAPGTAQPTPLPQATTSQDVAPKPVSSMDLNAMDRTADPCNDFFQFACGNWVKNNPIPADQTRWGRFNQLAEQNLWILRRILEKASSQKSGRDAVTQKIGDFYGACMDTSAVEHRGVTPLKADLERIAAIKTNADVIPVVADLHSRGISVLFRFGSGQDAKDATQVIAQMAQGGLSLPDRDYYLSDQQKMAEFRQQYQQTVAKMMVLAGWQQPQAEDAAKRIIALETKLAQASLERVKLREPENVYHRMTVQEASALAPKMDVVRYFEGVHLPANVPVNVATPDFFKEVSELIGTAPVEDWKDYLSWAIVRDAAPWLSDNFVNTQFEFFGKSLRGQAEIAPRWKRCVRLTDQELGEALGQAYVKEAFGPEAKRRMDQLVANVEASLEQDIQELDWMSPTTKQQADVKFRAIANKVGYPQKWRDYSSVNVQRDDLLGNLQRASSFEFHRQLNKIGKPVDKQEWRMTPPTVNAYYSAPENNINFPAGILQPPFFDKNIDDAVNYGGIGVVIGHELTHGFDDQGRKFDAQGNLRDWWTAADAKAFEEHAACIVNEYGNFVATEINGQPVKLNGKLTLGENTADNGGLRVAFAAMKKAQQQSGKTDQQLTKDGFTPEQRFFLGFGQVWCESARPETALLLAKTDPHSPGNYRANGAVQNFPEFGKAFGCKVGAPMMPQNACRVW